jgi:mono/diheme cytochrome c family protein
MRADGRMIIGVILGLLPGLTAAAQDGAALIRRGRAVYVAEGCIHCHSQYVRPHTADADRWGPVHSLAEVEAPRPPLLGNRRQGPDLQNVGVRRSAEWQRLHLQAPRALTPGSRMPAYAHLFRAGRPDGEALVAYLGSLGAATQDDWWLAAAQWAPGPAVLPPGRTTERLFRNYCASCHGAAGRGDGLLATRLSRPPRDFTRAEWLYFPRLADPVAEQGALARIIRFGLPGGAMAGHEYLADGEIIALAAYVQALRAAP